MQLRDRDALRRGIEVRDDVVADALLAAQLVDDRRQLAALAGQRVVVLALEAGARDAQEVVAEDLREEVGRRACSVRL